MGGSSDFLGDSHFFANFPALVLCEDSLLDVFLVLFVLDLLVCKT